MYFSRETGIRLAHRDSERIAMSEFTVYNARADAERAMLLAKTESPFTITVRFAGGLTETQMDAFAGAADRWVRVIVGDLPAVTINGEEIDDVLIIAKGDVIDGPGTVVGQAMRTHRRRPGPQPWALLPVRGEMKFDTADLATMEAEGTLADVITHEMGHVLGVGGLWDDKGLLRDADTPDPTFAGPGAMAEYHTLRGGSGEPVPVPVEDTGNPGTRLVHWRERVFGHELMTGFVDPAPSPLSRLTVASLGDLGYQVDLDAADDYTLPEPEDLVAVAGRIPRHVG
jgi:hypothetical protein